MDLMWVRARRSSLCEHSNFKYCQPLSHTLCYLHSILYRVFLCKLPRQDSRLKQGHNAQQSTHKYLLNNHGRHKRTLHQVYMRHLAMLMMPLLDWQMFLAEAFNYDYHNQWSNNIFRQSWQDNPREITCPPFQVHLRNGLFSSHSTTARQFLVFSKTRKTLQDFNDVWKARLKTWFNRCSLFQTMRQRLFAHLRCAMEGPTSSSEHWLPKSPLSRRLAITVFRTYLTLRQLFKTW